MTDEPPKDVDIDKLFEEGIEIDRAIQRAVRQAILEHKQAGNPIAVWQDGEVVWIPPEEIVIPDEIPRQDTTSGS